MSRVHNHPPFRPICNERRVGDQLRGACLNDDGSDVVSADQTRHSCSVAESLVDLRIPNPLVEGAEHDMAASGIYSWPELLRLAEALRPLIEQERAAARAEAEARWMKVAVMHDGEAIREARADAWDAGWTYAFEDHGPMMHNPYRIAREAQQDGGDR